MRVFPVNRGTGRRIANHVFASGGRNLSVRVLDLESEDSGQEGAGWLEQNQDDPEGIWFRRSTPFPFVPPGCKG